MLVGCSNNNQITKNQLFENRIKCENLKEKIKEENEVIINGIYQTQVDEVFYSSKRDSCLYLLIHNYWEKSPLASTYQLYDYFTKAYIDSASYYKDPKDNYRTIELQQTLKDLKWE